jgi:hypothetical protein
MGNEYLEQVIGWRMKQGREELLSNCVRLPSLTPPPLRNQKPSLTSRSRHEQGNVRGAMATEIRDVRRAAQQASDNIRKYNQAMQEMLDYAYGSNFLPRIH